MLLPHNGYVDNLPKILHIALNVGLSGRVKDPPDKVLHKVGAVRNLRSSARPPTVPRNTSPDCGSAARGHSARTSGLFGLNNRKQVALQLIQHSDYLVLVSARRRLLLLTGGERGGGLLRVLLRNAGRLLRGGQVPTARMP